MQGFYALTGLDLILILFGIIVVIAIYNWIRVTYLRNKAYVDAIENREKEKQRRRPF